MIGKLIGIDHGLVRIGVAVSDATGLVARELTIITRKSKREDFATINQIAAQENAVAIIIGLPYEERAAEGQHTQADTVKTWAARFAETTMLPYTFWDEQLTSVDAAAMARQRRRKPRDPIDDLAARVMLQSYLDALRDGLAVLPVRPTDDSPPSAE
ncbi:MAG: Holliday junction resolvase RuvX [bacterium]|nr:Holliday junction resolvase RuvX [bacterium]